MKHHKISVIFSAAFLLITLVSCKPRKAIALKESIAKQERVAFNILLGKNGPESQKLSCLVKEDFKGALAAVDKQEKAFDQLIRELETLPAEGIKQGNELKTAAVNYYTAVREMQLFDRVVITQQEVSAGMKGEELYAAQDKILELSRRKQDMSQKVHEKENELHLAMEKFNSVNGL